MERRVFQALAAVEIVATIAAVLLQYGGCTRGALTDVMCELLPPFVLAPLALVLAGWGAVRWRVLGRCALLAIASLALLAPLWPAIALGWLCLLTGWAPGK